MATGRDDFAAGAVTTATGGSSAAFNHWTMTTGYASFAAGFGTKAEAIASAAFGAFNLGGAAAGGAATWNAQDPLFEIGNGTDQWHRSNALTVYKNGTVIIPKAQGDILMGEFGP